MSTLEAILLISLIGPSTPCACCEPQQDAGQTYPRRNSLQGGDVVLQGQAAAVIEHGFHSGHVRLHQLLPLVGCLLFQRLYFLLEVLQQQTHTSTGTQNM